MEELRKIVIELLRDAKSRKFLLAILGVAIVVGNQYYDFGLESLELVIAVAPAVVFIIVEGIADIIERGCE